MNELTSRQRKLIYAAGILLLLYPIVKLGAPAAKDVAVTDKSVADGSGELARMRVEHDLGETTLGDIDPSSAAMNLVLLGLRGPAAGLLHLQAIDYQERKDWAKLRATVDSIIRLQPHYVQIWKFQGWNLAYNVSREWDKVDDRFYWVKEGIKFMEKGTRRNQTIAILYHEVGDFVFKKMGISDEKKFFREFFRRDPDNERYKGEADPEINPEGIDSYLIAYEWFDTANDKDDLYGMTGMTHVFFRQGPPKARMSFSETRNKEGPPRSKDVDFDNEVQYDEKDGRIVNAESFWSRSRAEWEVAARQWNDDYGTYTFLGLNDWKYKLNSTEEDLRQLAEENGITLEEQRGMWARNLDMVHYRFWRDYADAERDEITMAAHQALSEAKRAYAEGRTTNSIDSDGKKVISDAQRLLEDAMDKWVAVFTKYPRMVIDNQSYVEEALLTVYYWQAVHQLSGEAPPENYVLKALWDATPDRRQDIQREFLMDAMRAPKQ